MIRWLDFNDTWLAAEWGHPSDNLGGILATADWLSRAARRRPPAAQNARCSDRHDQGARDSGLHRAGKLIQQSRPRSRRAGQGRVYRRCLPVARPHREQTINALSLAWVDGQSLRTYRHAPNTGSRKSWAAGDATSRAVRLALMARAGEMGYPSALTAKTWGFYDVSFRGQEFKFQRPYGSYVMENVLFKISYPAEFHAQTAVEAAMKLRAQPRRRGKSAAEIRRIRFIRTRPACASSIRKARSRTLPTATTACNTWLRFRCSSAGSLPPTMRIPLRRIRTCSAHRLSARQNRLRRRAAFTRDYHDPDKRSIANRLRMELNDGTILEETVEYPIGHRRRREEGLPLLIEKFKINLRRRFPEPQQQRILDARSTATVLRRSRLTNTWISTCRDPANAILLAQVFLRQCE